MGSWLERGINIDSEMVYRTDSFLGLGSGLGLGAWCIGSGYWVLL